MPSPHSYVQITFFQIPILIQSNSGIHLNEALDKYVWDIIWILRTEKIHFTIQIKYNLNMRKCTEVKMY